MKVFISHSIKDMSIVNEFANILRPQGIEPYIAVRDSQPGNNLWTKIESNIKNSNFLLAILTVDGLSSDMVNQEVAAAKAFRIPIVPIIEKGVNPKGVLAGMEYIELDKDNLNQAYASASKYFGELKTRDDKMSRIKAVVLIALAIWVLKR